jgi:hypothetical protein
MVPETGRLNGGIMQAIDSIMQSLEKHLMKLIRYGFAAILALAVGVTMPAYAQHDHDGDSHHGRDKDKGREHREAAHERHEERHEAHERHEAREWHDNGRHEGWERHEAREHERHEFAERHYGRIDDHHWHEHFGREHRFVIERPVIVAGHPRFQYGGYWFVIGRPLPPGWRYTDEVYVDYIDGGYFMCSPRHPGVHISINIL